MQLDPRWPGSSQSPSARGRAASFRAVSRACAPAAGTSGCPRRGFAAIVVRAADAGLAHLCDGHRASGAGAAALGGVVRRPADQRPEPIAEARGFPGPAPAARVVADLEGGPPARPQDPAHLADVAEDHVRVGNLLQDLVGDDSVGAAVPDPGQALAVAVEPGDVAEVGVLPARPGERLGGDVRARTLRPRSAIGLVMLPLPQPISTMSSSGRIETPTLPSTASRASGRSLPTTALGRPPWRCANR